MSESNLLNNVLTIQTIQIAPFRTLMTALKDVLLETNITLNCFICVYMPSKESHMISGTMT